MCKNLHPLSPDFLGEERSTKRLWTKKKPLQHAKIEISAVEAASLRSDPAVGPWAATSMLRCNIYINSIIVRKISQTIFYLFQFNSQDSISFM
jgi:hypothetical protein